MVIRRSCNSGHVATTSPAGDQVQLVADHVGATVGLNADQLYHYLNYCSETLITELCNKIWQKISLLPR